MRALPQDTTSFVIFHLQPNCARGVKKKVRALLTSCLSTSSFSVCSLSPNVWTHHFLICLFKIQHDFCQIFGKFEFFLNFTSRCFFKVCVTGPDDSFHNSDTLPFSFCVIVSVHSFILFNTFVFICFLLFLVSFLNECLGKRLNFIKLLLSLVLRKRGLLQMCQIQFDVKACERRI